MDWMMIIQLIMAVLTVIMEFLGGGSFTKVMDPNSQTVYKLAQYEWNCGSPYWTDKAKVEDSHFTGTVTMDCNVFGANGGGLVSLHAHLVTQVENDSYQVHSGPNVHFYQGLPSHGYDVSLASDSDEGVIEIRGESNIATDGFTTLRSVFQSTEIPREGSIRYLKDMNDTVEVTPTADGWFQVRINYKSKIEKPWYVGSGAFKDAVVEKNEARMLERKEKLMNDLAANL